MTPPDSNKFASLRGSSETPEVAASRLAAAHERAGRLLSERYAERSIGEVDFEKLMERLRHATDVVEVDAVVEALHHVPRTFVAPPAAPASRIPALPDDERRILAFMSEQKRKGQWSVPQVLKVLAIMSDVKLDFRDTIIPAGFSMDVRCVMAQVTITVPPEVAVDFDVFAIMGTSDNAARKVADATLSSRSMVVRGSAVMGEVKVVVRAR